MERAKPEIPIHYALLLCPNSRDAIESRSSAKRERECMQMSVCMCVERKKRREKKKKKVLGCRERSALSAVVHVSINARVCGERKRVRRWWLPRAHDEQRRFVYHSPRPRVEGI